MEILVSFDIIRFSRRCSWNDCSRISILCWWFNRKSYGSKKSSFLLMFDYRAIYNSVHTPLPCIDCGRKSISGSSYIGGELNRVVVRNGSQTGCSGNSKKRNYCSWWSNVAINGLRTYEFELGLIIQLVVFVFFYGWCSISTSKIMRAWNYAE